MDLSNVVSFISLGLAIIFWILSQRQSQRASDTLNQIKDAVITWQAELNKVSLDIMASRPELLAKQSNAEETKSRAKALIDSMEIIRQLSIEKCEDEKEREHRLKIINELMKYNYGIITTKEQAMTQAALAQTFGKNIVPQESKNK